jgi:hypothetical protein
MPRRVTGKTALLVFGLLAACGAGASNLPREHWDSRLKAAIRSQVTSREQNQQNSRDVEEALDQGALKNLMRFEVRAALGPGEPCSAHPECGENGFRPDDWYYTVGSGDEEQVGKRPALIVGFSPHDRVERTWNLRVH